MSIIITPLRWILDLIYSFVGSYGVSIILFTLVIKLIILPLDIKQRHSMRKMQDIQPKIDEINNLGAAKIRLRSLVAAMEENNKD